MTMIACTEKNQQPTTFAVPAFDQAKNVAQYMPAFEAAIAEQKAEVKAIVNNPDEPTFENTLVALDRTGMTLDSLQGIFFNVLEADGNPEMDSIAEILVPMLTDLSSEILLNETLFQRIKAVYDERESLGLDPEQMRLLTETYKSFVNNGALLNAEQKARRFGSAIPGEDLRGMAVIDLEA